VTDPRVLDALDAVPRAAFLPSGEVPRADADAALPLSHGQTTSQPSLIAEMIQALRLTATSRVLEVGTGHGYEAALLARVAAEVWTVEVVPELAERAARILVGLGVANVHVVRGDGRLGLAEHAPYDGIVVAAQCDAPPAALLDQLAVGARLVAPVGGPGSQRCVVLQRSADGALAQVGDLGEVVFVPLVRAARRGSG
jgi:protein-L-isoaspartate(D-aspartate) O-methyltransferase